MSHEVEQYDGQASMIYAASGGTPWHRLGNPFADDAPEAHDVDAAIESARLGYKVEVWPLYAQAPDFSERAGERVKTGAFATVRTDTGKVLGHVHGIYKPIQQPDAFRPFQPMLDAGLARIEAAGVLRDGQNVWMLVKYDPERIGSQFMADEGILPYGLITNDHTGKAGIRLCETEVRAICWNTLSAALSGGCYSIRHTGEVEAKLVAASLEVFDGVVERYKVIADELASMRAFFLERSMFEKIVLDVIAPLPKPKKAETDEEILEAALASSNAATKRTLARREAVERAWMNGIGHRGDGSAFEAFSGAVEVLDHSDLFAPMTYTRVESMANGQIARLKERVRSSLLAAVRN